MQSSNRKKFPQLLLPALGYMVMGNLLSTIMTVSLAPFRGETLIAGLAIVFAIAIYLLLVAVPAYKNGLDEHTKLKKSSEGSGVPKYRWLAVGAILWAAMLVISGIYLLGGLPSGAYRLIHGATFQLNSFVRLPYIPIVNACFYALTIPACHIGFILGLGDKLNKDKIMY